MNLLFILLIIFLSSASSFQIPDSLVVDTLYGPVKGVEENGVLIWKGIPYASPPVGELRWKPPQQSSSWDDPRDCSELGKMCPQIRDGKVAGSEDCLYLNIYVPKNSSYQGALPVRFWTYGGGFNDGDSYLEGLYDGKNLALSQGIIVVTHNYRVGAFGFFGTQELADESQGTTGNYGVQDQTFALKWVRDNIKGFGGDPSRVMIWGQSAGAFSTCFHLASQSSFGLFYAALMESGTCDSIDFFRTFNECDSFSEDYAAGFNCSRDGKTSSEFLSCIRSVDTETVARSKPVGDGFRGRLAPDYNWGPVIDGTSEGLTDYPIYVIRSGKWANVPFVAGFNKDEGTIFLVDIPDLVPGVTMPLNETELEMTLEHFWSPDIVQVLLTDYYPSSDYDNYDDQAAAILRDYVFACPTRRALSASSDQNIPSWMYHFTYANDWVDYKIGGGYHGYEIPFVFDNEWPRGVHDYSPTDEIIAETFGYYWSNLAISQDVNVGFTSTQKFMEWPRYDTTNKINIAIENPLKTETQLFAYVCDYWDQIMDMETGGKR